MDILIAIIAASWMVLREAAPFVLLGLAMAGAIKGFMPEGWAGRVLGGGRKREVFLAAIIGAPLPL